MYLPIFRNKYLNFEQFEPIKTPLKYAALIIIVVFGYTARIQSNNDIYFVAYAPRITLYS